MEAFVQMLSGLLHPVVILAVIGCAMVFLAALAVGGMYQAIREDMSPMKGEDEMEQTEVRKMVGPGEFKLSARDLVGTLLVIDGEGFDEQSIMEIRERIHSALYIARKIQRYADEQYAALHQPAEKSVS